MCAFIALQAIILLLYLVFWLMELSMLQTCRSRVLLLVHVKLDYYALGLCCHGSSVCIHIPAFINIINISVECVLIYYVSLNLRCWFWSMCVSCRPHSSRWSAVQQSRHSHGCSSHVVRLCCFSHQSVCHMDCQEACVTEDVVWMVQSRFVYMGCVCGDGWKEREVMVTWS